MSRHARRKDENHNDILQAAILMRPFGMAVIDTFRLGFGMSDLVVKWRDNPAVFVEVKPESRREALTESEREWSEMLGSSYVVVCTPDELYEAAGVPIELRPEFG